jgi:hypothetical protein
VLGDRGDLDAEELREGALGEPGCLVAEQDSTFTTPPGVV